MVVSMKTSEILIAARGLIADPARWTRKAYARSQEGVNVFPLGPEAVCYCALGALEKVSNVLHGYRTDDQSAKRAYDALKEHANRLFHTSVGQANDTRAHGDILRLFDCAIDDVQTEEARS